jgi:GNAT superfamily N-acetyltransferase
MTDAVVVRSARPEDCEQVWPLARDLSTSYEVEHGAFVATFAGLLDSPDALLLVAEVDGRLMGYLLAQKHRTFHANGTAVWVDEVMVDPTARGVGVGRALMSSAEQWARDHQAAYVALATRRAGAFYAALDFEESATYFKRTLRHPELGVLPSPAG